MAEARQRGDSAWYELEYLCDFDEDSRPFADALQFERELLLAVFAEAKKAAHPQSAVAVAIAAYEVFGAGGEVSKPTPPFVLADELDFRCPSCGSNPDVDCHCKPGG